MTKSIEQPNVGQERLRVQLVFRDNLEGPAVTLCKESADREFAVDVGSNELSGRFDFDESLLAALHRHQKIGDDIGAASLLSQLVRGRTV